MRLELTQEDGERRFLEPLDVLAAAGDRDGADLDVLVDPLLAH